MTGTTRITTPFNAESTAAEVVAGIDLSGRRAVVTGGVSGIGVETARALAGAGAEVTLAVRDIEAGERTAEDITAATGNKRVYVAPLELADRASVAALVTAWEGPLHILVNNAGVMASPLARTPEGWELQFATNHLGHFGLATGLHRALAEAGGARVVSVSSSALQRHVSEEELARLRAQAGNDPAVAWKTPERGAATSVLLATSPLLDGVGGRYFEDCNEAVAHEPGSRRGVAAYALDPEAAARLWTVSEELLAN